MRIENNEPHRIYKDFWDWLFKDGHIIYVISLFLAYFFYLITTSEA
jgi:hypothetical protein